MSERARLKVSSKPDHARNFAGLAGEWARGRGGAWRVLHEMNEARLGFIFSAVARAGLLKAKNPRALDIGGGGGLVALPLAEAGFRVLAADPALPAEGERPAHGGLAFVEAEFADIMRARRLYDLVVCLEVVEHVEDAVAFAAAAGRMVRPGGVLIFSTINRSWKSWVVDIALAEGVLGVVPAGTHDWRSFVTPGELVIGLEGSGFVLDEMAGLVPDVFGGWRLSSRRLACNYIISFRRQE